VHVLIVRYGKKPKSNNSEILNGIIVLWSLQFQTAQPFYPTNDMKILHIIPFLLASAVAPSSAAVYLNDAVIGDAANILSSYGEPWISMGPVFHLKGSPNGFVIVELNRIGTTSDFQFIPRSIAGAYGLFQVTFGEELTYQNSGGSGWGITLNPGEHAYIGYWSQRVGKPPAPPEADDIYGWARVTNTAGNLVVISSASADTGIIVGTTQAIPEPRAALLTSFASLLIFLRRKGG
jgi:hypothetical protein